MVLRGREEMAVGVFLTDLYHHMDVRRRFREVVEEFGKDYVLGLVSRLACGREEKSYLRWRISTL